MLYVLLISLLQWFLVGMAFGTGSAVAHRAVDAVMGPRTIQHETVVTEAAASAPAPTNSAGEACGIHSKAFQDVCDYFSQFLNIVLSTIIFMELMEYLCC